VFFPGPGERTYKPDPDYKGGIVEDMSFEEDSEEESVSEEQRIDLAEQLAIQAEALQFCPAEAYRWLRSLGVQSKMAKDVLRDRYKDQLKFKRFFTEPDRFHTEVRRYENHQKLVGCCPPECGNQTIKGKANGSKS